MRRALSVLLLALLAGCSSGTGGSGVAPDLGHASVAELASALASRGLPCTGLSMGRSAHAEETAECTIKNQSVDLVHFNDTEEAERFAQQIRSRGMHAALAPSWAVVTPTRSLALQVADALGASEAR